MVKTGLSDNSSDLLTVRVFKGSQTVFVQVCTVRKIQERLYTAAAAMYPHGVLRVLESSRCLDNIGRRCDRPRCRQQLCVSACCATALLCMMLLVAMYDVACSVWGRHEVG